MFKRSGVEKRLRKISKTEAESVKLLEKQVNDYQAPGTGLSNYVEIFRKNN